jgi:hypothetical protein
LTMTSINKILLAVGLAVLLLTLAKVGSAQIQGAEKDPIGVSTLDIDPEGGGMKNRAAGMDAGVTVEVILNGQGFASQENRTHLLRINVERLIPLEPISIRNMLAANKSLTEIRDAIIAEPGEATYRGFMKLDSNIYRLEGIQISPADDGENFILDAYLTLPDQGSYDQNRGTVAGHLQAFIASSDEDIIGQGELVLYDAMKSSPYSLLLDLTLRPGMPRQDPERSN